MQWKIILIFSSLQGHGKEELIHVSGDTVHHSREVIGAIPAPVCDSRYTRLLDYILGNTKQRT